eukprot:g78400.t1
MPPGKDGICTREMASVEKNLSCRPVSGVVLVHVIEIMHPVSLRMKLRLARRTRVLASSFAVLSLMLLLIVLKEFDLIGGALESTQRRSLLSELGKQCHNKFSTLGSGSLAIIVHLIVMLVSFVGLAIACDEYFMASLEAISESLNLSEDVAGATFLAAASSAPELFSNVIDTFFTENSIGVGTIIGSAMFNILIIIAASGVVATKPLEIDWRPLLRDIFFYLVSMVAIFLFFRGSEVTWLECLILLLIYMVYILFMKKNQAILSCLCPRPGWESEEEEDTGAEADFVTNNQAANITEPGRRLSAQSEPNEYVAGNTIRNKFRAAAVLTHLLPTRVVVTQYHQHNEELAAALNVFLKQRRGETESEDELARRKRVQRNWRVAVLAIMAHRYLSGQEKQNGVRKSSPLRLVSEGVQNMLEGAEAEEGSGGYCSKLYDMISFPLIFVLDWTIVDCRKEKYASCYMVTFFMSVVWIAAFSFVMVTSASLVACILGIPEIVMGVTVLAAGTSIPDMLGSIIATKQGMGGMAVANAIGSNVFDICIGLALPWIIKTLYTGEPICVFTAQLTISIIILFATVVVVLVVLYWAKWHLNKQVGAAFMFSYGLYVVYALVNGFTLAKRFTNTCK